MDVTARVVSSECHLATQWSPAWEGRQPWAAQTQGVWDFRSGIRFQLGRWRSVSLDGHFCAPLDGADLPVGSAQLALEPERAAAMSVVTHELCQ